MPVEYLPKFSACRDIGHQWDYYEWTNGRRTLICFNCETRRTDTLSAYDVVDRSYKYPRGYAWKGEGYETRELRRQLRREAAKLARWVGKKPHLHIVRKRA
jgi:hypothetical protein